MKSIVRTADIEVFGDLACPWCYVVKRRLQTALRFVAPGIRGRLLWRGLPIGRSSAEKALAHPDTRRFLTDVGAAEGIEFALDRIARVPDTAAALSLVSHVRDHEHGNEMIDQLVERIYSAFWSEGRDIESAATLLDLANSVGVNSRLLAAWSAGSPHTADWTGQQRAAARGIDSIPFVLINDRVGVRGTRSTRHLAEAIQGASWFDEERAPARGDRVA